ncbi:YdeI/OmpD-associated family protein [Flavobacterium sp.]|uniref:YdeI/OmpD-associated family protein n=1 Tax=Flavobacterium sp. TaxID=239 RepID=UPI003C362E69
MKETTEHYFKNSSEWREWLEVNHAISTGINVILYKVSSNYESMRWEEAVQVALCYGWIDSTSRKIDDEKRKQQFGPRKDKSVWSRVNKSHIEKLDKEGLIHASGYAKIATAKANGSWESLDAVESLTIPMDLEKAFQENELAYSNYLGFSPSYKKSYLYWLNQAKRNETRQARITAIIDLCAQNIKSRF